MSALIMMLPTGCLLSPPLEPLPPEENLPPSVLEYDPETPVLVIQSQDEIVFSVLAGDPNAEPRLDYAWIGEESGLLKNGSVTGSSSVELRNGVFHTFETIELTLNPCSPALRGLQRETLWLYIADRELNVTVVDPVIVETDGEGYVDVWTWVLNIRPETCL